MDWSSAAEGVDHVFFRDVARSHHLSPDKIRHLAVDDVVDAACSLFWREIERLGNQPHDRFFGRFLIELATPAEEIIRIDVA